jgi:hypothetical protein
MEVSCQQHESLTPFAVMGRGSETDSNVAGVCGRTRFVAVEDVDDAGRSEERRQQHDDQSARDTLLLRELTGPPVRLRPPAENRANKEFQVVTARRGVRIRTILTRRLPASPAAVRIIRSELAS